MDIQSGPAPPQESVAIVDPSSVQSSNTSLGNLSLRGLYKNCSRKDLNFLLCFSQSPIICFSQQIPSQVTTRFGVEQMLSQISHLVTCIFFLLSSAPVQVAHSQIPSQERQFGRLTLLLADALDAGAEGLFLHIRKSKEFHIEIWIGNAFR